MQIDDEVVFRYFDLLSSRSNEAIAALRKEKAEGRNPREIKALLGREIVERFHGAAAADHAQKVFDDVYGKGRAPDDVPLVKVTPSGPVAELAWALKQAGLVPSTNEARRLIEQGGVEVNDARVTDPKMPLARGIEYQVRVGSKNRRFARIHVVE
jgi:tyrosyl-tRNA synthetase